MRKKTIPEPKIIPEPKAYLKPWMLIVSVIIVAILVGAVIYSGQQSIVKTKDEDLKKSESRISELSSQLTQMQEYIKTNLAQKEEPKSENIIYTNSDNGFSMEFPKTWEKYTTKDRKLNFSAVGSANSIDFYFDENSPIFNIAMIDKTIWDSVKDLSYYTPTKIAENDKYVFAYSVAKGASEEIVTSKQEDINIILNSFKALDNTDTTNADNTTSNTTLPNPSTPVAE